MRLLYSLAAATALVALVVLAAGCMFIAAEHLVTVTWPTRWPNQLAVVIGAVLMLSAVLTVINDLYHSVRKSTQRRRIQL